MTWKQTIAVAITLAVGPPIIAWFIIWTLSDPDEGANIGGGLVGSDCDNRYRVAGIGCRSAFHALARAIQACPDSPAACRAVADRRYVVSCVRDVRGLGSAVCGLGRRLIRLNREPLPSPRPTPG